MMNCPLYSDIQFELMQNAKRLIVNFDCLSMEQKFISILKCNEIQPCPSSTTELSHSLQSLSFKCTCGLEYRPVSIANGNAPGLKSAIVRLTDRKAFKTRFLLNFFNFFNMFLRFLM
jgi:hypothetical protein